MTPITYLNQVWERCDEIEVLYLYLSANTTAALPLDELLRSEWAARVSALDLYIHELIAQNMISIFEGTRPNCQGNGKFKISNETLRRIRQAPDQSAANAAYDLEVRDQLSRKSYQYPDDIADGIRLISDRELWNEIALAKGATPQTKSKAAKNIKTSLSIIIERRNKIVHEGDLQPTVPRIPWPIDRNQVNFVSTSIRDIVQTIDATV